MDKIKVYLGMIGSLIETSTSAYNNKNTEFYNHVKKEINDLAERIKELEHGNLYNFPKLEYESYPDSSDLMKAISVLKQMKEFLISVSGEKVENVESLEEEIRKLNNKVEHYEKKERDYLEIIKKSKTATDYQADEEKIKKFSGNNLKLIKEALDSYAVGAYTACVCVCRTILQDLVQRSCKENSIAGGSLKDQIEKLISKRIIKEEYHSQLLSLSKFFGHRAAHPTTEVFDRDKTNLILSSLFIVNEELFGV